MDLGGLVVRWIPEWQGIRNSPQTNPLHVYTVDRHSIEAVIRAGRLAADAPHAQLLLLTALFHDIGKGDNDDHAAVGAAMIPAIATRLGLDADTGRDLEVLVRHHLLISDLAAGSDVDHAETVSTLLDALGHRRDMLEALRNFSEADATASGPDVWIPSREDLVNRLMAAATARLGPEAQTRVTGTSE